VIGAGGFATVWKGVLYGELPVAIKVLHIRQMSTEQIEGFLAEVHLLSVLRHPHVVQMVGACLDPPDLAIALELCLEHSLRYRLQEHLNARAVHRDYVVRHTNTDSVDDDVSQPLFEAAQMPPSDHLFSDIQVVQMALAIARAMAFMHARNVLHRDLKPANILFDRTDGTLKVCDFGLSHFYSAGGGSNRNFCGTPGYMAPETINNQPPSPAADVFAFAIVLWELLSSRVAWRDSKGRPNMEVGVLLDAMAHRNLRPRLKHLHTRQAEAELEADMPRGGGAKGGGEHERERGWSEREVDDQLMLLLKRSWLSEPFLRPASAEIEKSLEQIAEAMATP